MADAGSDQSFSATGIIIQLNANQSYDHDGDSLTYAWKIVSFPSGSSTALTDGTIINPSFEADFLGTYVIQFVVIDEMGAESPADQVNT